MRDIYPLLSAEINDKILMHYENMISILGYNHNGVVYSGLYDQLFSYIQNFLSTSGIPHVGFSQFSPGGTDVYTTSPYIIHCLKFDYIYRKNSNSLESNFTFGAK